MYDKYKQNPKLVNEFWQEYFAATPLATSDAPEKTKKASEAKKSSQTNADVKKDDSKLSKLLKPLVLEGDEAKTMKGVAAVIAENMDASLTVPTATSVRSIPTIVMEKNRVLVNNFLKEQNRKISFTHLIAYAVIKTIDDRPAMNIGYGLLEGKPTSVQHSQINLGLAVDLQKPDGSRALVVPSIKGCDNKTFSEFLSLYEELIKKVKSNKLKLEDYAGTTCTITNPGMIGTVHSIPRLMPGQSFILGVGSINYPASLQTANPEALKALGISKEITLTNTYDHRVVQGAESGDFLNSIHKHLIGETDFYEEIFKNLGISTPPASITTVMASQSDTSPIVATPSAQAAPRDNSQAPTSNKDLNVYKLIEAYRSYGHKKANLDPLGLFNESNVPELELNNFDLEADEVVTDLSTGQTAKVSEIIERLENSYCKTITGEFTHLDSKEERQWCYNFVENNTVNFSTQERAKILTELAEAFGLENFLATKYVGQKRFGVDGGESLLPLLSKIIELASKNNVEKAFIGMAHRGRLNVLANILKKPVAQIIREVEGRYNFNSALSADVKYHLGFMGKNQNVDVTLAPNPSHLEAVGCVVLGMARNFLENKDVSKVVPIVIHGDAAHPGQGVVAETYNMSLTPAYFVGGAINIIVNNQIGFTTDAQDGRSTRYSSDIVKGYDIPVIHVNADDVEDCVKAAIFAFEFRQKFQKDVCIDLVCYRKNGHNEGDEPSYTQPIMYKAIKAQPSSLSQYIDKLNTLEPTLVDPSAKVKEQLTKSWKEAKTDVADEPYAEPIHSPIVNTGVDEQRLQQILASIVNMPEDFSINPKLEKILGQYPKSFEDNKIEWGLGEMLAYGALLQEGVNIRLCGEDARRGTFSHRHGAIRDTDTNERIIPINSVSNSAELKIYDSTLSEYAALGFEYGHSVEALLENKKELTIWEAQFGDFVNGAQIIIDQFISSGFDKWQQNSNLVMLLPNGMEGQGPEHSSARLERFLQLCAKDNMIVAYPTTSAQLFHLLRRQIHGDINVPLIVMTPKKFLRMNQSKSPVKDFTNNFFAPVLPDINQDILAKAKRVVFTTGKFGHELMTERDNRDNKDVAVIRIEQLAPFPVKEIKFILSSLTNVQEFVWAQEETANAGALQYVLPHLQNALGQNITAIARPAAPSPAVGSPIVHNEESTELLNIILGKQN